VIVVYDVETLFFVSYFKCKNKSILFLSNDQTGSFVPET